MFLIRSKLVLSGVGTLPVVSENPVSTSTNIEIGGYTVGCVRGLMDPAR